LENELIGGMACLPWGKFPNLPPPSTAWKGRPTTVADAASVGVNASFGLCADASSIGHGRGAASIDGRTRGLASPARLPFDALLISDYAKGFCTPTLLRHVIDTAREFHIPVIVDPARIVDYSRYRGATLIKPNRIEAETATRRKIVTPDDAIAAA